MYTLQQLAALRAHPDRLLLVTAILDAHDALSDPTATSRQVMERVRDGRIEVLFDAAMPPGGGLTPGENPVILGGFGVLSNPQPTPDPILGLVLSTVHEGVHHLDVAFGRCQPGVAATAEERFFTELHAYAAEYELAVANQLEHLLAPEFRGVYLLDDIAVAVLTVECQLVPSVQRQPGLEQRVTQRVGTILPAVPRKTP
jgi:hypothetical protein